jgi:hypothetical protein
LVEQFIAEGKETAADEKPDRTFEEMQQTAK